MPAQAPVSHHLSLFEYWLAKRGARPMPARKDINPADIPMLLPYVMIIGRDGDQLRYRLVGSAIVRELGRDLTGGVVGSFIKDREPSADVRAIYYRAFTAAHPVFSTGKFHLRTGSIHNASLFILPLSDDGTHVSKVIATLVARFNFDHEARPGWLKGQPLKICTTIGIRGPAELGRLCLEWELSCKCTSEGPASPDLCIVHTARAVRSAMDR